MLLNLLILTLVQAHSIVENQNEVQHAHVGDSTPVKQYIEPVAQPVIVVNSECKNENEPYCAKYGKGFCKAAAYEKICKATCNTCGHYELPFRKGNAKIIIYKILSWKVVCILRVYILIDFCKKPIFATG